MKEVDTTTLVDEEVVIEELQQEELEFVAGGGRFIW